MLLAIRDAKQFIEGSIRLIEVSIEKGIKAYAGKLNSDTHATDIQAYDFTEAKGWNMETAHAWVKEHAGKTLKTVVALYKDLDLSGKNEKKITKLLVVKALSIDEKEHTALIQITGEEKDRDDEIIPLNSWKKHNKSYIEHPVLVSSHKYDNLLHQIGEAKEMDWDKMQFKYKWYAGEGNPEADWGWKLTQKGMAMFSVGFRSHMALAGDAIPVEYRDKEPYRVLTDNELYEVSQVIVGSYRGALQMGIESPSKECYEYAFKVAKSFGEDMFDFEPKTIEVKKEPEVVAPVVTIPPVVPAGKEKITSDSIIISPVEIKNMKELETIVEIYKSGRIISEKNRTVIKDAIDNLQGSIKALTDLLELTAAEENTEDEKEKALKIEVEAFLKRNINV